MAEIYDLHDKAFAKVSAFVIVKDGERVATVAIKFPADGAGRLWAYVHWVGIEMVRGHAGGYGHDKRTAAVSSAAGKLPQDLPAEKYADGTPHYADKVRADYTAFRAAILADKGPDWDSALRSAGFKVWQAV